MKLNDVGIIVTTFIRDPALFKCIKSIRQFYPDIKIYVVDQGKTSYEKETFLRRNKCNNIRLPYDSGLALARNVGMIASKEKYMIICDDDFIFLKKTRLENWKQLLCSHPKAGIAAGILNTNGLIYHYEHELRKFEKFYVMKEYDEIIWKRHKGIKYHYCDLALNWFMMKRECWKDCPWDSDYKIAQEHLQFFLDLKDQGKWKVIYTPTVLADHEKKPYSDEYEVLRASKGRKRISWIHYYKKTGIRFGVYITEAEGGLRVIDLLTGELVSDHHLYLTKTYGDSTESPVQKIYKAIRDEIDGTLETVEVEKRRELSEEEKKLKEQKDEFWKQRIARKKERRINA